MSAKPTLPVRLRLGFAATGAALSLSALAASQALALRLGAPRPGLIPRLGYGTLRRLLGLRVTVTGTLAEARPLLIAANHVSWLDIVVLGSLAEVAFVSKTEVSGWPGIGALARLSGTVFVDRADQRGSHHQAASVGGRLSDGRPLVLFPEGTTGDGYRLLPFKSSLFGAAGHVGGGGDGLVIQPAAIAYVRQHGLPGGRRQKMRASWIGDEDLVPHLMAYFEHGPMDVEVHFGAPFRLDGARARKDAAHRVRRDIEERLAAAHRAR